MEFLKRYAAVKGVLCCFLSTVDPVPLAAAAVAVKRSAASFTRRPVIGEALLNPLVVSARRPLTTKIGTGREFLPSTFRSVVSSVDLSDPWESVNNRKSYFI